MARAVAIAPVLLFLTILGASAQGDADGIRKRLEPRFDILPVAEGVVLRPRFRTDVRTVEVSDAGIAIDGEPVTGGELRQRLGGDADVVLQVTYLDRAARRSLANVGQSATPAQPSVEPAQPSPLPNVDRDSPGPRARGRGDVVRIGGSVSVASDETVNGDVVVIGGSANVDGEVRGDVVVIAGAATLGPRAVVRNDVTVVGGGVTRDPQAVIYGDVNDVGMGQMASAPWMDGRWSRRSWGWDPTGQRYPAVRLIGTLARAALMMLLMVAVLFVARAPVEQIADRAAAEPVKSWAVGFLAELLFVPVLVLTVVALAISIIGIPLLILVPVAIVAAIVAMLVGFTGVAYHIGRVLQQHVDVLRMRPYAATCAALGLILAPLLLARLSGLVLGWPLMWALSGIGFVLEYVAWTIGLGAAALARFGAKAPAATAAPPPVITT
jgi:hypothetical protein